MGSERAFHPGFRIVSRTNFLYGSKHPYFGVHSGTKFFCNQKRPCFRGFPRTFSFCCRKYPHLSTHIRRNAHSPPNQRTKITPFSAPKSRRSNFQAENHTKSRADACLHNRQQKKGCPKRNILSLVLIVSYNYL